MKFLSKLSILGCISLLSFNAFSQQQNKQSAVHLGLVYPLSTHGKSAKQYTNEFSFHAVYGISGGEKSFILSGIGSSVFGNANGVQIAGIFNNIHGDAKGFSLGGVANIAGDVKGTWIAGVFNTTLKAEGFLLAGVGNFSGDVKGFQFAGVVNKANKVDGVQFAGLLNIADSCDYPIGIINIIRNGEKNAGLQFDELQDLMATFRSGSRYTYGILGLGYNLKHSLIAVEIGLGYHINCTKQFRIDTELVETKFIDPGHSKTADRCSFRIMPAFSFLSNFNIFAGPSLNFLNGNAEHYKDLFPSWSFAEKTTSKGVKSQWYVGYVAGVQYRF